MLSGEHSAGCKDIFASRRADSRCQSAIIEPLLEVFDDYRCGSFVWEIRNLVETDQVHSALKSLEHPDQRICMCLRIVETGKHRILEAYTALACEVVLLDEIDHFLDRPCSLYRHNSLSFRTERIMEADSKMTLALVKIALEVRQDTDCR